MSLSILVDGKGLSDSSAHRGIGTYLREILRHLALQESLALTVLTKGKPALPAGVRRRPMLRVAPGRWEQVEHDALLPLDIVRTPTEVFHSPAIDPPRFCRRPWVQTLHDVIPMVESGSFSLERRRWERLAPRFRRADAVIAISQHCADLGIEVLGLDHRRVHVVRHGVSSAFAPAERSGDAAPYVLYVGEFDGRKGYDEAFDVIGRIADAGFAHTLKVAGRIVPWTEKTIEAAAQRSGRRERIELLGYVDHESALPALYQQADAVLITSRHEGFGLPTIEAMASGTPVIAFDNTATREVVGTAGVLVPDGDVKGFADAVVGVLKSSDRQAGLREAGLARAQDFSWSAAARAHAEVFAEVASR